jgi:hypothetical protein
MEVIVDWTEKELKDIENVIRHLNVCVMVATGLSLRFSAEAEAVELLNESRKTVKRFSVAGDSALGILRDIVSQLD